MKNLKFLQTLLLCTVLSFCFVACSNDDDENDGGSKLVGRWEMMNSYWDTILVLKENNTGHTESRSSDRLNPIVFDNFTSWECTDTQLFITWEGNVTNGGYHPAGTYMYYYILEGDMLTIYHSDGDLWGVFKYLRGI